MPRIDDLERAVQDLRRQLAALQRVDVNPPLTSTPKYSGTPTAGHYAAWSGAGTVVDSGFGTADLPRYSGTPTANALAYWPGAGTVAGAASITVDGSNNRIGIGTAASATFPVYLQKTSNAAMGYAVENLSNGNAAQAFIEALNDAGNPLKMGILGSGFSTVGVYVANLGFVQADSSDLLVNAGGSHTLLLATNNTERARIAPDGTGMSIGTGAAPTAQLDVLQATLGSAVLKLASTATNGDPTELVYQNRVTTTNNTATTIHTFTIPASTTYLIDGYVIGRRTGGSGGTAEDGAYYRIEYGVKNISGTATQIAAAAAGAGVVSFEDQAGWDCAFTLTGATAVLKVTGATNNNVVFHMTARVYLVST